MYQSSINTIPGMSVRRALKLNGRKARWRDMFKTQPLLEEKLQ
jgi:hypothetical protein